MTLKQTLGGSDGPCSEFGFGRSGRHHCGGAHNPLFILSFDALSVLKRPVCVDLIRGPQLKVLRDSLQGLFVLLPDLIV
jgi:hypothetical protein